MSPVLTLTPHCTEERRDACTEFQAIDGKTLKTSPLMIGDILQLDIVVKDIGSKKITTVRSWLDYDPSVLEARDTELNEDVLPSPIPGEVTVDAAEKIVKIGGSNPVGIGRNDVAIARVTFKVLAKKNTTIGFHNFQPLGTGETALRTDEGNSFTSATNVAPPVLEVIVTGAISSSASSSSAPQSSAMSSIGSVPTNAAFTLLQIQNVKVTSQGTNLFIGWDTLRNAAVKGYNVYYGTVSGRYIQRRSLPRTSESLAVRGLEQGTQYFVAVRAFDESNTETTFSQEESAVIGRPETSTAPLLGVKFDGPDGNPMDGNSDVIGATGLGTAFIVLIVLAALIGTMFATRRQFFHL